MIFILLISEGGDALTQNLGCTFGLNIISPITGGEFCCASSLVTWDVRVGWSLLSGGAGCHLSPPRGAQYFIRWLMHHDIGACLDLVGVGGEERGQQRDGEQGQGRDAHDRSVDHHALVLLVHLHGRLDGLKGLRGSGEAK